MATQYWAEGVWRGKWSHELKEAWMRRIREVQTWKQVRGPAGALMCETRDLGIKWLYWHTLISSNGYSEKHKSWRMAAEGFKGHVATDGSLLWNAGNWRACGWAVVQLDCGEELGLLHGMYFSTEAVLGVSTGHHRKGGVDTFLVLPQKSTWTHQDSCGQRWKN